MNLIGEVVISAAVFAIAWSLLYVATTFKEYRFADRMGPAFWPETILVVVIILSGVLLFKNLSIYFRGERPPARRILDPRSETDLRLILSIILSLLYGFGVPYVGFLLSIFVFQLAFLLILKVKNIAILIAYPLSMTVVLYIVFIKLLYIPLSRGVGPFLHFSRLFY